MLLQNEMILPKMIDSYPKISAYSLWTWMQFPIKVDVQQVACYTQVLLVKSLLKTTSKVRHELLKGQAGSHVELCYVKSYALNA